MKGTDGWTGIFILGSGVVLLLTWRRMTVQILLLREVREEHDKRKL